MWRSMRQGRSTRPSVRLGFYGCCRPASSSLTIRRSWWRSSRTTVVRKPSPSTERWTWTGANLSGSSFKCTPNRSDQCDWNRMQNEVSDATERLEITELLNRHQIYIDLADAEG